MFSPACRIVPAITGQVMTPSSEPNVPSRAYVIERVLPGAGRLSNGDLAAIARRSCSVLDRLGPTLRWIHSYVTDDRIYCIYSTPDEALIKRHAELGGFSIDRIAPIASIIDPSTAFDP